MAAEAVHLEVAAGGRDGSKVPYGVVIGRLSEQAPRLQASLGAPMSARPRCHQKAVSLPSTPDTVLPSEQPSPCVSERPEPSWRHVRGPAPAEPTAEARIDDTKPLSDETSAP